MDVGITTIHNHLNYGAVLQVYALTRAVQNLGHSCKVVENNIEPGHGRKFTRSRHPGEQLKNLFIALNWKAGQRYCHRFDDFSHKYIPKTKKTYHSLEELIDLPPKCDAYITGSDQVWHPNKLKCELGPFYHLSFADPEKSRLIAYAPSFGVSSLAKNNIKEIRTYLLRYHALSIREKQGQEIIYKITGKKVAHVFDPTLLLTLADYAPIIENPKIKGDYLLVYPMELGDNLDFYYLVKKVKKALSIPAVFVFPLTFNHRWLLLADKVILDAGPKEFLGLIKNASFVCSNSFHGTIFSILFQREFLGVPHTCTNTRVYSLLEKLGLLDRQICSLDSRAIRSALTQKINYKTVSKLLDTEVKHSLTYLKNALYS